MGGVALSRVFPGVPRCKKKRARGVLCCWVGGKDQLLTPVFSKKPSFFGGRKNGKGWWLKKTPPLECGETGLGGVGGQAIVHWGKS